MKGTFFNKNMEWNIETTHESWPQGETISGVLKVKKHGKETLTLQDSGVALSLGEIKKVQSRSNGALKIEQTQSIGHTDLTPGAVVEVPFSFKIDPNAPVTDKKQSYYLSFGQNFNESQLQLKISPKVLYLKVSGLMDTFYRFKLKEFKAAKKGVDFKFIPPSSREMANIESLLLTFTMEGNNLTMMFQFQVKKLDTTSLTNKLNKETLAIKKELTPKEYSLGPDLIHQDQILQCLDSVLSKVKLSNVF
jgi:hypothetical protein